MPRAPRVSAGGLVYHALNRGNTRMELFSTEQDYLMFEDILISAHERVPMRTLGYCIMPNHWHLVLWPREDGDISAFMRWLAGTHTQRWHARRGTIGTGHIYQGRYKSFPVQQQRPTAAERARGVLQRVNPVLSVLRYVERNPVRAGLLDDATAWRWSSAWRRLHGEPQRSGWLTPFPGGLPEDWVDLVNRPQTEAELNDLRRCVRRGCPYGTGNWTATIAERYGLQSTLRPRGRPRNPRKPRKGEHKGVRPLS